jgi:hypothetical protein
VGVPHVTAPEDFRDVARNIEDTCRRAQDKKLHSWTMAKLERFVR